MQIIECKQNTPDWWSAKRGVPSASSADRIVTPKGWDLAAAAHGYAIELVADTFDGDYGPKDEFQTAAMRNGHVLQPEARDYYAFHRGCSPTEVGFCLSDCGRFGASPDSLVSDDGLLEIKSPTAKVQVKYLLEGGVPSEYLPQLHWQLIVTGRKWVDLLCYCPGFPKLLLRVEPNDRTETMRGLMDRFWIIYQDKLRRITEQREEAIIESISRKGDQLPDDLKALAQTADPEPAYF